jgi:hypothetical protein
MNNKLTFVDCLKKMCYPYVSVIFFIASGRIVNNFLSTYLDYAYLPARFIILLFKPGMDIGMEWPIVGLAIPFIFFASLEYLGEKSKEY